MLLLLLKILMILKIIYFRFNQYFQTQGVVITDLHEMIVTLYKDILLCFLKRNYVMQTNLVDINPMNGQYQLVDNELYLGSKVMLNKDNVNIICNNNRRKEFFEKYVINCSSIK